MIRILQVRLVLNIIIDFLLMGYNANKLLSFIEEDLPLKE